MTLMRMFLVVRLHKVIDARFQLSWCLILINVNIIIFQGPKEAFNDDVIRSPTFTIHTDFNIITL